MICGVIDIGSNTIRLSTYEYDGVKVRKLFHKKNTAGLASYIEDDIMSEDGINRCCQVLMDFKGTIDLLSIDVIEVFATASLRNIKNSADAIRKINEETGYSVQLLSGNEEAEYGYYGIRAMYEMDDGIGIDIGGGSTELTLFQNGKIVHADSFPVGSLNMYKKNITKIIPSEKEKQSITKQIKDIIGKNELKKYRKCGSVVAVGGSARAILEIANVVFHLPEENQSLSMQQIEDLNELMKKENKIVNLILQICPDRIHTLVPGLLILTTILKETKEKSLYVCPFGVREGYLYKKMLNSDDNVPQMVF